MYSHGNHLPNLKFSAVKQKKHRGACLSFTSMSSAEREITSFYTESGEQDTWRERNRKRTLVLGRETIRLLTGKVSPKLNV